MNIAIIRTLKAVVKLLMRTFKIYLDYVLQISFKTGAYLIDVRLLKTRSRTLMHFTVIEAKNNIILKSIRQFFSYAHFDVL